MPQNSPLAPPALEHEVYSRLREIAQGFLARERRDHTLQPTALVHEAYLRLLRSGRLGGLTRSDLVSLASAAMRHILVDHARRRRAAKRGGAGERLPLDEALADFERSAGDLVELDSALERLGEQEPAMARIVTLRFFGGLTEDEVAAELDISARTVRRAWSFARLWLAREMRRSGVER